jgi:hypothetical protein
VKSLSEQEGEACTIRGIENSFYSIISFYGEAKKHLFRCDVLSIEDSGTCHASFPPDFWEKKKLKLEY